MYISNALNTILTTLNRFATNPEARGAFYVMSRPKLQKQVSLWLNELPSVKPYYAVKCNPERQLLNYLYDKDVRFDCASERELLQVKSLARGPFPEKVVYANPCKSKRDLLAAADLGSPVTVVDSEEEVDKLASVGYEGGAMIRIAVDDSKSPMPFSTKFGCSTLKVEQIGSFAAKKGILIKGISFHVGSGGNSGSSFVDAVQRAYTALSVVRSREGGGHGASTIDIGGGFSPDESIFKATAKHIRKVQSEINKEDRDATGIPTIQWIAEPGRFFAKHAFDLYVQVIGKKAGSGGFYYTLDDSLYGQFSCILFDHAKPSWTLVGKGARTQRTQRKQCPGVLFGRTCDSLDVIARADSMEELEVGDWLYFPSMGAYTRATASEFNGFPRPAIFEINEEVEVPPVATELKGIKYMPALSVKDMWLKATVSTVATA
jgi:ornithine decarboxylase